MLFILYKYAYMKLILIVHYKYNNTYKESSRFLNFKHDVVIFCYIYIPYRNVLYSISFNQ